MKRMCADGNASPSPRVLVLGGTGFIGRHAVAALLASGCDVVIGSRHPQRIERRLPDLADRCAHRQARLERLTEAKDWTDLLAGIDVVMNCVGILRQRGRETYQRVHHLAPAALAEACRGKGLRLIHVSALGLHANARSRFLRSKVAGEEALRKSGADWLIVRPSLLDGEGGYGAKWLRRVARWPLHALPADATGRIAALHVADLGEALARLALAPSDPDMSVHDRIFELGGTDRHTLQEYLALLRRMRKARPVPCLRIPSLLARIGSHLCDLLHVSPYSFGHWELLREDNCPHRNRLPELLGHSLRPLGAGDSASHSTRTAITTVLICGMALVTACTTVAPQGLVPAGCSGVPGDLRTPDTAGLPALAAGQPVEPIQLVASARPFNNSDIALLYVFDESAAHVTSGSPLAKVLNDPVFAEVEGEAYWKEVSGGQLYRIPWQDKCSQASMLREPLSFRAPRRGLLFVQYVVPSCTECDRISAAIRKVIATHPELPVSWVRIQIPASAGRLNRKKS
jgi:uncharacterized protein YbjT (DUF2867 family)